MMTAKISTSLVLLSQWINCINYSCTKKKQVFLSLQTFNYFSNNNSHPHQLIFNFLYSVCQLAVLVLRLFTALLNTLRSFGFRAGDRTCPPLVAFNFLLGYKSVVPIIIKHGIMGSPHCQINM